MFRSNIFYHSCRDLVIEVGLQQLEQLGQVQRLKSVSFEASNHERWHDGAEDANRLVFCALSAAKSLKELRALGNSPAELPVQ